MAYKIKKQKTFMFKDIWRKGFYTISSLKHGYETFPTKKEAEMRLKEIKKEEK
jgi:hypothetical protein